MCGAAKEYAKLQESRNDEVEETTTTDEFIEALRNSRTYEPPESFVTRTIRKVRELVNA